MLRGAAATATLFTSVALIAGVCVYVLATTGVSTEKLRDEAEAAIKGFSGLEVDAVLGPARVSVDRSQLLAVEVPNISLRAREGGAPVLEAGKVDFGIRALPLLSGSVQLGSARVSDARIYAQAFGIARSNRLDGCAQEYGWTDRSRSVPRWCSMRSTGMFDAFGVGSTRSIELDDVEVVLPAGSAVGSLSIDSAIFAQTGDGDMQFSPA